MDRFERYRARKRGEDIPKLKPGPHKGYKQTDEHIQKRTRCGPEHHNWVGDNASQRTGRSRAERKFNSQPCESCGVSTGLIDRHHIDGDTLNNEESNIRFLCRKCHMREDGRQERFIELARKNQPTAVFARWH